MNIVLQWIIGLPVALILWRIAICPWRIDINNNGSVLKEKTQ